VSIVAGWVRRGQQEVVEYLQEENRVLREQLGDTRLRFTHPAKINIRNRSCRVFILSVRQSGSRT